MTDITELAKSLKSAAENATPGEWVIQLGDEVYATNDGVDFEQVAIATLDARDADYIALANPVNVRALVEALEKAQTINAAAEKLVRCKGRYHSEQNYRALAALFGVVTPDLPPIDGESRTVTVKLPDYADNGIGETWDDGFNSGIDSACDAFRSALTAAGIKLEAK